MKSFDEKDILILAKAVTEDAVYYFDCDNKNCGYYCEHCTAFLPYGNSKEDFKHLPDCPVLLAKDIIKRLTT